MTNCDVIGIGNALVDMLVRCDDAFLATHSLTKGHMHLIDHAQATALQAQVEKLSDVGMVSGGSVANSCLGYASFGGSAAYIGCVNDDWLGEFFAGDLGRAGVPFTQLAGTNPEALGTGHCYCLITPDGERTMCTYLGTSSLFGVDAVTPAMISHARLLFIEGYLWGSPGAAANDALVQAMKAQGGMVALTLSDGWVADAFRDTFLKYCSAGQVDVLFGNQQEIMTLTGCSAFDAAVEKARTLAPVVALTCGAEGALILKGSETVKIAAAPVDRVVDATGAGDLFAAGFLYGYLSGGSLAEAGQLGALAAAEIISHIGARPQVELKALADKMGFQKAA